MVENHAVLERTMRSLPERERQLLHMRFSEDLSQSEIATDVMFTTRPKLLEIWPDLVRHAALNMSTEDVLGFLGR